MTARLVALVVVASCGSKPDAPPPKPIPPPPPRKACDPGPRPALAFEITNGPRLATPREKHVVVPLPDGRLLVANGLSGISAAGFEVLDATRTAWKSITESDAHALVPNIPARAEETVSRLPDGRTLFSTHDGVEIADATGARTVVGRFREGRTGHTATVLPDCRVVFIGGLGAITAEVWNAAENRFDAPLPQAFRVYDHTASLAGDGSIVVTGGEDDIGVTSRVELWKPVAKAATPSITFELADPVAGPSVFFDKRVVFLNAGDPLREPPQMLESGVALAHGILGITNKGSLYLWDGGAWTVAGDVHADRPELFVLGDDRVAIVAAAKLQIWTAGTLRDIPFDSETYPRIVAPLPDGRALVLTGPRSHHPRTSMRPDVTPTIAGAMILTIASGALAKAASPKPIVLRFARRDVALHALADGRVVFGHDEIYDPKTNAWTPMSLVRSREDAASTLLRDGRILYMGGERNRDFVDPDPSLDPSPPFTVEIFDPVANRAMVVGEVPINPHDEPMFELPDGRIALVNQRAIMTLPR